MTTLVALATQACGNSAARPTPSSSGGAGAGSANAGGPSNGGNGYDFGGGPTLSVGGSNNAGDLACGGGDLLAKQALPRVLYSWTTEEQAAELRAGGPLFSRSESPGKGRGLAMTQLAAFGAKGSEPVHSLAAKLADTVFAKLRFSWTNPWATLMGWPGETYGNQLLQVTLRPEAWIAYFTGSDSLRVRDMAGNLVDISSATANPERIGAIYFESKGAEDLTYCGTFSQGAVDFREFVLGNLAMVQTWSLSTPEIAARLQADIAALEAFSANLTCRGLPPPQASWAQDVSCTFSGNAPYDLERPLSTYDSALAIPSELYYPSPENIAAIVAALKLSLPQGEPLTVNPGG